MADRSTKSQSKKNELKFIMEKNTLLTFFSIDIQEGSSALLGNNAVSPKWIVWILRVEFSVRVKNSEKRINVTRVKIRQGFLLLFGLQKVKREDK